MDRKMSQDLDNYITGHYGEDQFAQEDPNYFPKALSNALEKIPASEMEEVWEFLDGDERAIEKIIKVMVDSHKQVYHVVVLRKDNRVRKTFLIRAASHEDAEEFLKTLNDKETKLGEPLFFPTDVLRIALLEFENDIVEV